MELWSCRRILELSNPGILETWKSENIEFWKSGFLEFWISGILDFWNSGILEVWNFRFELHIARRKSEGVHFTLDIFSLQSQVCSL